MNRTLRTLCLTLLTVVATGALSASAASAADFHSESGTDSVIKGSQVGTDVYTFNAGTDKCDELTYMGDQSGATATTWKVSPTWTGCTAFGFVTTSVDVNGCTYEFSGDNSSMTIACPEGRAIVKTAFNCWITIGPQTVSGISYANTGAGSSRDMDISLNISGLKYTQHSKSFPGCTNGSFSNGTYKGLITVQGFATLGTQVGIWRE